MSRSRLPGLLASEPASTEIRFLPAATLPLGQVSRSLAHLRSISPGPWDWPCQARDHEDRR